MPSSHFLNAIVNYLTLLVAIGVPLWGTAKQKIVIPEGFQIPVLIIWALCWGVALVTVLWPLSNQLYLLIMRRTGVRFKQARELSPLFWPIGTWYPAKQLKKLPKEERIAFLYWLLKECVSTGRVKYPKWEAARNLLGLRENFDDVEFKPHWGEL